ncbi:ShlB/FhaC/HecB family hemolysin secretion/activation protein [Caenimonas soli]|uniref:ShlB/FhaC/HecB family hemolysin secretion/activation protein n=1 Tax=Caenimonas soli TaxID=2735555 RepID=UPI00155612BB|nr:ShlB/FhaC/HecB family hemolysin secretion/activation protein [Caenimonas soli]NPC58423.1 ShlB/FhaC/HecB family hemolysin secretion/activation protein [Caenimonas soli]
MKRNQRVRVSLWPFALLALSSGALAQQPPSAGGQIQQIPPAPVPPRPAPEIRIEQRAAPTAPAAASQVKIVVRTLRVTGASLYSEADLIALTGFAPGGELSLADLQAMAARITEHYRRNGYFAAQAFLPAQDIKDNAVTIAVSEGRYGKVALNNQSNLSDGVALNLLGGLNSGDPIATPAVESRLLLLSDQPGVNVKSTLVPGAAPGTSDLLVDVTPGQRVTGSIDADNGGNRYTGVYRIGATVNVNNPLGLGDVASLRVLTSGHGLKYARASYQLQAGRGQVGVAYSRLDYSLGKEFESLQAHGTAEIVSVYGRYPLVRSRNDNVYVQLAYDAKTFEDKVDSVPSATDKKSGVLMASVFGDHRDSLGGGGLSSYSLTWSAGKLDIETPAALAADALTARTNGHFNKLSFSAMRLQSVGGPFSVYAGINGQLASKNLDVSEKMELGGMNAVRAYPEGEAYADQGFVATLEGRMDLPKFSPQMPGHMQLVAFVDSGTVTLNKNPWVAGSNRRTLNGAGVGVNWGEPGNFMVRAYYAHKLGSGVATSSPDKSGRFWVQLVKYF